MVRTLLFPSEPFNRRQVDTDMRREYDAALETGLFEAVLFSYDDWFHRGRLLIDRRPDVITDTVYRGWMMKPGQFEEFYKKLHGANIRLVTTPEMYSRMHLFPNTYRDFGQDTARIMTFPLHETIAVDEITRVFPRFMVKDYVKSVKGTEFPAYFDQSISQEDFNSCMQVFYKYRGDLLTGGICVKEYLDLKRYDGKTNEFRVFYMNHRVGSIARNSLQGCNPPEPPTGLIEKRANLDSIFYTVDYAELESGAWKVIEAGDGSVSGLSDRQDHRAFYKSLYDCMNAAE